MKVKLIIIALMGVFVSASSALAICDCSQPDPFISDGRPTRCEYECFKTVVQLRPNCKKFTVVMSRSVHKSVNIRYKKSKEGECTFVIGTSVHGNVNITEEDK